MIRHARRTLDASYLVLLVVLTVGTLGWLTIGGVVATATYFGGFAQELRPAAEHGSGWAAGVIAALPRSEPPGEAVLDYGLSLVNLVLAGFLLFQRKGTAIARLLAIAMIASAGAFNLQAHASTTAMTVATGVNPGRLHEILLHGVGCAAFVVALLLVPMGRWNASHRGNVRTLALLGVGAAVLMVVGIGTALLPHTVSCVLFFGFSAPLVGLVGLPSWTAPELTVEQRSQTRLMFSVLLAAFLTCVALGVITAVLWYLGQPGLYVVDPSAQGGDIAHQPTALLFWFSRLAEAGIALAVLVSIWRNRLWAAERLVSRGLAAAMVIVLLGGGYVVARAITVWLPGAHDEHGALVATVLAALLLLPGYQRARLLSDRLLYGERPTPYSVLAEVTALARTNSTEGPNLARAAEAIGRGLGARCCRLTVLRPGLRERAYLWSDGPAADGLNADGYVELPISQGGEQIGSIAVDRGSVAGLHAERRTLLADVADSLGAVLQASRTEIELERQLRTLVASAEDIAMSRREAVAEMDSERRTIERDLHDGAQHHLVTLRLAIGLVEHEVSSGQLEQARDGLARLPGQIKTIEEILAKTASGVSSAVLAQKGLAAALSADLSKGPPQVTFNIDADLTERRVPPAAEAAVYFCCLEAVNNARKHAPGAPVTVSVGVADGELRFAVRDEGPGFDPEAISNSGRGQRNLAARIRAVGGRIGVESAPGTGTTVSGAVPLRDDSPPSVVSTGS
jgi:signal transduction histidine kinase